MFPHSMAWNDLTGRIVLANSPRANDSWAGNIFGLAMYRTPRTARKLTADYGELDGIRENPSSGRRDAAALYLFDERGGAEVHNKVDSATDLSIPTHYFILHPGFLVAPWKEYSSDVELLAGCRRKYCGIYSLWLLHCCLPLIDSNDQVSGRGNDRPWARYKSYDRASASIPANP